MREAVSWKGDTSGIRSKPLCVSKVRRNSCSETDLLLYEGIVPCRCSPCCSGFLIPEMLANWFSEIQMSVLVASWWLLRSCAYYDRGI